MDRRLTVVVVSYMCEEDLSACLASLERLRRGERFDLVVVDNSPGQHQPHIRGDEVKLIHSENRGYAAACNLGFRYADTEFVLFMNADARYRVGSLTQLLDWLGANGSVALVGPRIVNPDGSRQFSCRRFPTWTTAFAHRSSLLTRVAPRNFFSRQYLMADLDGEPTAVDWASGCCLVVRSDAFRSAGGFDEEYFLYFEDVDLAYRMRSAGGIAAYYPGITFEHRVGCSRTHLSDHGIRAKHESAIRFFRKNVFRSPWAGTIFERLVRLRARVAETANKTGFLNR